jgi:hypothetical protein
MSLFIIRPYNSGIIKNGIIHGDGLVIDNANRIFKIGTFNRGKLNGISNILATWTFNPFIITLQRGEFTEGSATNTTTYISDEYNYINNTMNIALNSESDSINMEVNFENGKLINLNIIN